MKAVIPIALTLAACDSGQSGATIDNDDTVSPISRNDSDAIATPPQADKIKIKIRTLAGEPNQTAYLVDRPNNTTPDKIEAAVRESGNRCSSVRGFYQLEQKGELMDVFKIVCSEGSYQLTAINGNTYFKPWTGNMMGSTE